MQAHRAIYLDLIPAYPNDVTQKAPLLMAASTLGRLLFLSQRYRGGQYVGPRAMFLSTPYGVRCWNPHILIECNTNLRMYSFPISFTVPFGLCGFQPWREGARITCSTTPFSDILHILIQWCNPTPHGISRLCDSHEVQFYAGLVTNIALL